MTEVAALNPGSTVGIFGGGQLGRMLAMAATQLGLKTHIYSDVPGPATEIAHKSIIAPYADLEAISAFAQAVDVITFEFENVPLEAVQAASAQARLSPGAKALEVAQDRFVEKSFVSGLGIPVAPFAKIDSDKDFGTAIKNIGCPAILKTRRLGYDGKGQVRISADNDLANAYDSLGQTAAILEGVIQFEREVSVLIVRRDDGQCAFYDLPENTHKSGILDTSTVPAPLDHQVVSEAHTIARTIADALGYVGLLAIELFVMADGQSTRLLVNEIAPRVHNSGHWTLDACQVSQFENHIRAIAGWPLGATDRHSDARMTNLIGDDVTAWGALAARPSASLHLYGKAEVRAGRKMGHLTEIFPRTPQNIDNR